MAWRPERLILSCEHAVPAIPARYAAQFAGAERTLASHRGYDYGALELARRLRRRFGVPLVVGRVSRLLVDLNRSEAHADCFSAYVAPLSPEEKARIVERYHVPHRRAVCAALASAMAEAVPVLHLGVHTFTPVRRGVRRRADVALLYDPRRTRERQFAEAWKAALRAVDPRLEVRSNYPYRGSTDGLTTSLRRVYPERAYLGIELEVNQRFWRGAAARKRQVVETILCTLEDVLR